MSDTQESKSAQEVHGTQDEPGARVEPTAPPDEIAPPLVSLIASIRTALTRGASAEARAAGATACRSILTVLDAKPGQPLAASPQPLMAPASPASPLASLLSQPVLSRLAAMSREELINLLKQVTGAMPARAPTPSTAAPRFHLIEIPQVRRP